MDQSLHASAILQVDEWIASGREDISGADDVRAAEKNDAVTIGMCSWHVKNDYRFAIKRQILLRSEVFVVWPQSIGNPSLAACRLGRHTIKDVLMSDNPGALPGGGIGKFR